MAFRRSCVVLSSATLKSFRNKGVSKNGVKMFLTTQETTWAQYTALKRFSSVTETSINSQDESKGLRLSDSCVEQLLKVTKGDSDVMLRIAVQGGGCSGFQYSFDLDSKVNSDDKVFERVGAKLVIDDLSLSFLEGSMIDYHKELIRSSFRVADNPNAELGCSCGASFALK